MFGKKSRTYGHDKTIHRNESLDVEVDKNGQVVAVWFRCQALPFKQSDTNDQRAAEMRSMYADGYTPALVAVEVVDSED